MRFIVRLLVIAAFALPAAAQQWPTKPVRFVVPFPPGGTVDPLARLMAAKLGDSMGQQFVVENRPGAGGSIGTAAVAKAAPDGYTFVFVFDSHAVNQALIPNLPFDTMRDLAPVMLVGRAPYAIAAHPGRPYQSFADVVKAAKGKPDAISIGSIGNGTLGHLTVLLAQQVGGFQLTHVPYKGGGPMTQDLLGGQIDLGIGSAALLTPQARAGKVRVLATTGEKRAATLPDVPTLSEQGIPGVVAHAWWGILAPAGTPRPIIERFHAELAKALNLPDVRKTLGESLGMELLVSSPEAMEKFVAAELERWGKVVKEHNVRID
jgi:tripartite-type tricarboxylate transporter receptor subunit TctC